LRRSPDTLLIEQPSKVRRALEDCARPALRGSVTGLIVPVVVWGDEFPSWLLVLKEPRMQARVVVLTSETQLAFVQSLVEEGCLIVTAKKAREILDPNTVGHSSLCLVDGRVASDTARFLQTCGVTRILGTKGIRRSIPGWSHATWTSEHVRLGGVATEKVEGVCLSLGSISPAGIERPDGVGRDASAVLSIKAPARHHQPAPPTSTVSPLGCQDLGTSRFPCFHGGGLLPGNCDRKTVVSSVGNRRIPMTLG
jgi:hypothetical protein